MTWRKLSDSQWAAAWGMRMFHVELIGKAYQAQLVSFGTRGCFGRPLGRHSTLRQAKRRCEAERIMG